MENVKGPDRWRTVADLSAGASSLDPERRDQFLREQCAGDDTLRREVEDLLDYTLESTQLFDKPALEHMAEQLAGKTLFRRGSRLGHFEVKGLIGAGGMGRVYSAKDLNLNHNVAIKVLLPGHRNWHEPRERFMAEARAMISLNHPNICRFFQFDFDQDVDYIVMEYIDGETLRDRLSRSVDFEEFTKIAEQCLQALIEAHGKNIIHRDIKPENIMLSSEGHVKLCDFGLAKWLRVSEDDPKPRAGSGIKGTLGYVAPEVWLGKEPDARSDIYSLGVVFYEILSQQKPFAALPPDAKTTDKTPLPLPKKNPSIPVRIEKVIARMLQQDPNARYGSAAEVLADLMQPRPRWDRRIIRVAASLLALSISASSADRLHDTTNVAVLPCTVIAASREDGNFCNGLMESVVRKIIPNAAMSHIEFADPSDVRSNRVLTPEQGLDRLGAQVIVSPAIQRTPERLHVTISVSHASTGIPAASEVFFVDSEQIAGLERALAISLSRMLGITMLPAFQETSTPPEAMRLFLEGVSLLEQYDDIDNIDRAIVSFSGAVGLAPSMAEAHARLGEAYTRKYDSTRHAEWLELARNFCDKSLYLNQSLAAARRCLAMLYNTAGDYYKAIDQLNAAINVEPTDEFNYRELARAKARVGDLAGAEKALRDAVSIRPEYWAPYASLGRFYTERANYLDAVSAYEEAIRRSRMNIQARYSLSTAYRALGRYDDAIRVLRESIRYRPTHQTYSNLGSTLLRLRRFTEAAVELEHARNLNPRAFTQIGNLARAYYFIPGKREQSFAFYTEAVQLADQQLAKVNPRDPDVHIMLAWYNAMLGHAAESYRHLDQALQGQPPPEFFWIAAIVHNQFSERDRSLSFVEKAASEGYSKFEIQNTAEFDNLRDDPRFRKVIAQP
jgi:serine/threonine-protein kinase